jgi:short-subunit dehydrogenase
MTESILITGANAGLGKETARQLALKKETKKVILFCRNRPRAEAAKKDLEAETGKRVFEIIIGDVTDANSVRKAVEEIKEPIDAIVLNAEPPLILRTREHKVK